MAEKSIVIMDDEAEMLEAVSDYLGNRGFRISGISKEEDLFSFLGKQVPDMILLDIMFPGANGFDICRKLKKNEAFRRIPIIILSARGDESDKVLGLNLGADDYLAKPFSFNELHARIEAVLRRQAQPDAEKEIHIAGLVTIYPHRYEITVADEKVSLTPVEFKILMCLSSKINRVFSREAILEYLWGEDKVVTEQTIDVHIKHLREKLGKAGKLIKSIRGIGYKIEETS